METFAATTTDDWRAWLAEHGRSATEIWLVIQHRDSGTPSPRYHEAIEHALCYGWIDSQARGHDADSSVLRFTPRNPRSTWSQLNRERAARMTEQGFMTDAGQALIDLAQEAGTWRATGDGEMPADLRELLDRDEAAHRNFERFSPSSKRLILEWVASAKRPETRRRRITRTVELAAVNLRANHPVNRLAAAGSTGP